MTTSNLPVNRNRTARAEINTLRKAIVRARTSVAQAGQDAAGDPDIAERLTAQRLENLRRVEGDVLTKIVELRMAERDVRDQLGSGLGIALTDQERTAAVQLSAISGDMASMPLAEIEGNLRGAVLREDRPAMFVWAQVARSRLRDGAPGFGENTRDRGRHPEEAAARSALVRLTSEVDRALQDTSADPVLAAADALRDAAMDLQGQIDTARANRGEGPTFGDPRIRTVKLSGYAPTFDPTGYEETGVAGYGDS